MNKDRRNQEDPNLTDQSLEGSLKEKIDRGKEEKGLDILKYLNIVLVILIILVGLNRFGLVRGPGSSRFSKEALAQVGMEYYLENYGDQSNTEGARAVVQSFGCHEEIHIYQGDKLMMRLIYSSGKVYEL